MRGFYFFANVVYGISKKSNDYEVIIRGFKGTVEAVAGKDTNIKNNILTFLCYDIKKYVRKGLLK